MANEQSAAWTSRAAAWRQFVEDVEKTLVEGKGIPVGPSPLELAPPDLPPPAQDALSVVVCSPHPDDEALIGALPLRLRREAGARVTDCAITFGSNLSQRARRRKELESACRVLGFDLVIPQRPAGFDNVNLKTRAGRPDEWAQKVETLSQTFAKLQPDVVFAPHAEDWNTTHIGAHYLAVDALGAYLERTRRDPLPFVETEFWHENSQADLMVGVSAETEAILVMATAEHGGEVLRNPYHVRHPARMIENVRLGAETVGGQGGPAPDFPFAELYRVTFMKGRQQVAPRPGGRIIGPKEKIDLDAILKAFRPEGL
ncbi:MAG: PIG-L family deacetylase [Acidobacteriia bacterium]|nr:PIG-L family deacetylase [Terriglobia bacterium]